MAAPKTLKVSVIIPVYNEEDYLADCLKSIDNQTMKPYEVIVVDNNSTDKTVKIAEKYKFVRLITEPKQGVLFARTTGFNAAKGDIIGRIDADTRLEPNWIEKVITEFEDPDLAGVTGSSHWYDMPLSPWNHWVEDFFKNLLFRHEKKYPFLFGTNMAIRASAWKNIRKELCKEEYIFEDADLAIHLYLAQKKLLYDINLRAGMSARRASDNLKNFIRYIKLSSITYKRHGIRTIGASIAIVSYMVGYVLVRPLFLAYDPKTKKRSLKQLIFSRKAARPHPF